MIGSAPRSAITGVPGWETPAEQELLVSLAKAVPKGDISNGIIVNIGAEYGMSDSLFAHGARPDVLMFSIDIMLDWSHWVANLKSAGFDDRIVPIRGDSSSPSLVNAWKQVYGVLGIDLLFIDGDHSYAGCKKDIEAWTPLVKVGGRVAFHDCACATNKNPHPLHFEVTRALSEWYYGANGVWKSGGMTDSIMVFERVK